MIYFLIIILFVALDQWIKYLISTNMQIGESIPIIGDMLSLTYVRNSGAAFSMLEGWRAFLIIVPILFIITGIVYLIKHRKNRNKILLTSIALIISGGLGNLIDRILNGYVVDYIQIASFPVFNLADMCVTSGCALLIIYVIFFDKG